MTDPADPGSTPQKPPASEAGEARPSSVLDSILREGGPLPPARLGLRALALLLDTLLLGAASILILSKVALPLAHPGALYEFRQWLEAASAAAGDDAPPMGPELLEALAFAQNLMVILFWAYFAAGEAFFRGSSLGKRACRLRTFSTVTLEAPTPLTGIVRGGAKTFVLFFAFPLLLADLIPLFFNRRRQTGHDLITRTAVIDEKFVKMDHP
jgi:uncharacterized RDD family membrane protein YckC